MSYCLDEALHFAPELALELEELEYDVVLASQPVATQVTRVRIIATVLWDHGTEIIESEEEYVLPPPRGPPPPARRRTQHLMGQLA